MDRVTERKREKDHYCFISCSDLFKAIGEDCPTYERCLGRRAYEKLAHYEDLEEQGRRIEQKYGKWIKRRNKSSWTHFTYSCSVCDSGSDFDTAYCPNCGAKMDEVENE